MTGRDAITASLKKIGAIAPGESISAEEATDGLAELNRMLASWSIEGLLGFEVFTSAIGLDDEISMPPGYDDAIVYNLAVRQAPDYGKAVSAEVAAVAATSKGNLKRSNMRPLVLEVDEALMRRGYFNITAGGTE